MPFLRLLPGACCAVVLFSSLFTLSPRAQTQPPPATSFEQLLVRANTLFKEGKLPEALAAAQQAAKSEPSRFESPALAALILHQAGRTTEAQAALAEAKKLAPADKRERVQAIARAVETPVARQPGAVASTSAAPVDSSTLSGPLRRRYDTLMLIIEDADSAKLADDRKKHLAEFLGKSEAFAKEQPALLPLWTLRAVAALELNRASAGREAAQQLVKLGAEDSSDPKMRRVLAMLDRKGWLNENAGATAAEGKPMEISDLRLSLLWIAPGTFTMGSPAAEQAAARATPGLDPSDEGPQTRVTLTKGFWLGKTEVTQAQWQAVMGNNPSHFKGDNLPVEKVSWDDAVEFCRRLTERERDAGRLPDDYRYTLPTEAQWEYACRAGTESAHAGTKQANGWDLHDMHGNVWEWCLDWYADKLPGGSVSDPTGAASGSYRVYRGGCWWNVAASCRSAFRYWYAPGYRAYGLGFRLALSSVP